METTNYRTRALQLVGSVFIIVTVVVCCCGCWTRLDDGTPMVRFSTYPGLYESGTTLQLELSSPKDGTKIFYTLDGSRPTRSSRRYDAPIKLTSTTTVRAIAYKAPSQSPERKGTFTFTDTFPEYVLGQEGPAGGSVFYDKKNYDGGWRYMEAAPQNTEWRNIKWFNGEGYIGRCSGEEIGNGLENTLRFIDFNMGTDYRNPLAATRCWNLIVQKDGISYRDWFLPSGKELLELWTVLEDEYPPYDDTLQISWYDRTYWSSSEYSDETAGAVRLLDDGVAACEIRALCVRYFSPKNSFTV